MSQGYKQKYFYPQPCHTITRNWSTTSENKIFSSNEDQHESLVTSQHPPQRPEPVCRVKNIWYQFLKICHSLIHSNGALWKIVFYNAIIQYAISNENLIVHSDKKYLMT